MLSLSPIKLLIVLVVAVILVGPDKLPQLARQMGAGWRTLRQFHQRVEQEVRETIPDLPSSGEIARMARSPVAFLNQLADLPGVDTPVPDPGAEPEHPDGVWPVDGAAPERGGPERGSPEPVDQAPGRPGAVGTGGPLPSVTGSGPAAADPSMN